MGAKVAEAFTALARATGLLSFMLVKQRIHREHLDEVRRLVARAGEVLR